jgi:hypothetical protein
MDIPHDVFESPGWLLCKIRGSILLHLLYMSGTFRARDPVVFMGTDERIGKVGPGVWGSQVGTDSCSVYKPASAVNGVWNEVMACMMMFGDWAALT